MSLLETVVLAIVEGLTEFLPVSSTGHLIITSALFGTQNDPYAKLFIIVIQFGAILSVIVLYWKRFFQTLDFYFKLFVAFLPAAVAGLLAGNAIDHLLSRVDVVGYSLVAGGIFFLFIDDLFKPSERSAERAIGYSHALRIGLFQVLALIPGVSRAAATIVGGLSQKFTRKQAAEFSFFLAVPTLFGAATYKVFMFLRADYSVSGQEVWTLIIGNIIAFLVAIAAIRGFIRFLTRHGFKFFGYYRILVGCVILLLYYLGAEITVV